MACKNPTNEKIRELAQRYIEATKEGSSKVAAGKKALQVEKSTFRRVSEGVSEIVTSSYISGFTTHAVNIVSASAYNIWLPSQKAIGRLARLEPQEAINELAQAYEAFSLIGPSMKMAWRALREDRQFLDTAVAYTDQMGPRHAFSSQNFGIDKTKNIGNKVLGNTVDAIGSGYRLTGHRVMGGMDEAISQMQYRGYIKNQAMRRHLKEGMGFMEARRAADADMEDHMTRFYKLGSLDKYHATKRKLFPERELTPEDIKANAEAKKFNAELKATYDAQKVKKKKLSKDEKELNQKLTARYNAEKKRVLNERGLTDLEEGINQKSLEHNKAIEMHEEALEYSREMGFKSNLDPDAGKLQAISYNLQKALDKFPLGKVLLVPFLRTPTIILETGVRNTFLLQGFSKGFRKDLFSDDTAKRSKALGQFITSSIMAVGAYTLIEDGTIEGSISSNWQVQRNAQEAGVQPYSFIIGKGTANERSIQYNYLDPIMFSTGMLADFRSEMRRLDLTWEDVANDETMVESLQQVVTSLAAVSSHYVYNKSYMQGIASVMDIVGSETTEDKSLAIERWIKKQASAFVPNSISQYNQFQVDESRREARNLMEAVKARLPILSQTLPPAYDILGIPQRHTARFYGALPLRNSAVDNKLDRAKKDSYVRAEIMRLSWKTNNPIKHMSFSGANGKMDYRDYFPHGATEGEPGTSFFDAMNLEIAKRGELTEKLHKLMTRDSYIDRESKTSQRFKEKVGDDVNPNEFGSNQMKLVNDILNKEYALVRNKLLQKDEWRFVKADERKFKIAYALQKK